MTNFNYKNCKTLTEISHNFIIKYTHHVIWRQLDPPDKKCGGYFRPTDLEMLCHLPSAENEKKSPKIFRKMLKEIKLYFSDNLVRPVYEALSQSCQKFVCENRLKYGDVILSLVFQDSFSQTLELTAKHMVFRKWSLREEMCLKRTLMLSRNLFQLFLPGKATDMMLILISKHCQMLENLDISTSYVTDKGLLAVCGVEVVEIIDNADNSEEIIDSFVNQSSSPEVENRPTRAAAVKARARLEKMKTDPSVLRKLAIGGYNGSEEFKENFSLVTEKMKPYVDKRLDPDLKKTWSPKSGSLYRFTESGCTRLKRLDLTRTNYPKRSLDKTGKRIFTLGLTRDSVLASLILLKNIKIVKWLDLGEILQLYEMVFQETGNTTPTLGLTFLMDSCLTLDKLEVANRICPKISRLEISMFNFSIIETDFVAFASPNYMNSSQDDRLKKSINLIFNFPELVNLEAQYMDDSKAFNTSIQNSCNLTRICLNKMVSISFETLAAVKKYCKSMEVFEVFVDLVYTFKHGSSLEQVIAETENTEWKSLKSLKLGGFIPTGSIMKFLIYDCPQLRMLCYSPYEAQAEQVTDLFVEQILGLNPLKSLVAFYFEKCHLTEQSFFLLLSSLPRLKFVGILAEWLGLDRRARLAIKAFVRGNNVDVDIDSAHELEF